MPPLEAAGTKPVPDCLIPEAERKDLVVTDGARLACGKRGERPFTSDRVGRYRTFARGLLLYTG